MINVASYELCEELSALTGWGDTPFVWAVPTAINKNGKPYLKARDGGNRYWKELAAYDAVYLLEKLKPMQPSIRANGGDRWEAECEDESILTDEGWNGDAGYEMEDKSMHDAMARLAVMLISEGIFNV